MLRQAVRVTLLLYAALWLIPAASSRGEILRLCAERRHFCHPADQTVWVNPGGPDQVPCQLEGLWKVSLCIEYMGGKCGHTWIRYEHNETGEVHTIGRYIKGTGGIRDADTGEWMYRPAEVNGVQWDLDMSREHLICARDVSIVTVLVENPRVYRGADNGYGHGICVNNCVTFARDAWLYYSGEHYPLCPGLHTADTLEAEVLRRHPEAHSPGN